MCGICGILDPEQGGALADDVRRMSDALVHRGPDAAGLWEDSVAGIALGHRRLAIIDITEAGAQPMVSACGRWVIIFNGEIYNHRTLRADLATAGNVAPWRGTSDTETLIAAIAHWGLEEALRRAYGMFALALWDRQTECLHLARDRMGEKPLYLAQHGGAWYFASELRALFAVPSFRPRLSADAVAAYLMYGYTPEGLCIIENVQKVPPGHVATLMPGAQEPNITPFQTFEALATAGLANRVGGSANAAVDRIEGTLATVVDEQMLSDVPLGCFLSGGIDSSLVAALMQSQRDTPISTFSIGFDLPRFNEAPHAAAVARHLRTDHTEFILSEQDALAIVSQLPEIYDEPFADSSQIPTVLLCREARKSVTVALSGDGGDEVFGGYNRHIIGPKLLQRLQRTPVLLRRPAASAIGALAPMLTREDGIPRKVAAWLQLPPTAIDKAVMLAPMLARTEGREDIYRSFTRLIAEPSTLLAATAEKPAPQNLTHALMELDFAEWMMAMDSVSYLPGDVMVKVDRAAMAASLETRTPFLDARVVEAAWSLPKNQKIHDGQGKQILRQILDRHVPRSLIDRPKQGFAVPLDRWLRGALREWAEALLQEEALFALAGLAREPISRIWSDHQDHGIDHGPKLWCVLMLLAWLREHAAKLQSLSLDTSSEEALIFP